MSGGLRVGRPKAEEKGETLRGQVTEGATSIQSQSYKFTGPTVKR